MKFTEGAFRDWGYALAQSEFGGVEIDGGPWTKAAGRHCRQGCNRGHHASAKC